MLTVNEIFHSIQGESSYAGRPCVFVRLTACDLRCSWCDTPYAFHEGRKMSVDEVVSVVDGHGCSLVEITGGEPLLQEDVYPLMERLLAGGESDKNDWSNLDRLAPHDEVKFVIQDRADYDFARKVIATRDLAARAASVLLSPVHGVLDPKTLSEWMLADRLPARLQLQLHKYIWSPSTRGV